MTVARARDAETGIVTLLASRKVFESRSTGETGLQRRQMCLHTFARDNELWLDKNVCRASKAEQ